MAENEKRLRRGAKPGVYVCEVCRREYGGMSYVVVGVIARHGAKCAARWIGGGVA